MKIINTSSQDFKFDLERQNIIRPEGLEYGSPDVEETVEKIIGDVCFQGDQALIELTKELDGALLTTDSIRVRERNFQEAIDGMDPDVMDLIIRTGDRIRAFHEKQKLSSWSFKESDGTELGQIIRPIKRVGVYVPGGKAFYPSTVLMNVIPAQVAGVKEIAICSPPDESGTLHPCLLAAADHLGVKEVYRVGGAQAIAAMAYGTETIPKVDKIVGPGNIYVTKAKKQVFGAVGIDMIAGPSEIVVVADESADAEHIAADLLSQAEHDEDASSILITHSQKLAEAVDKEIEKQTALLSRPDIIRKSLENYGRIYITQNIEESLDLTNKIAPEHLELIVENPKEALEKVENAGSIFLGPYTPEALGDYGAGPNHVLPTGGTSRFSSPLGVYDFYKRSSVLSFTEEGLKSLGPDVVTFSTMEGLDAHAESVQKRLDD